MKKRNWRTYLGIGIMSLAMLSGCGQLTHMEEAAPSAAETEENTESAVEMIQTEQTEAHRTVEISTETEKEISTESQEALAAESQEVLVEKAAENGEPEGMVVYASVPFFYGEEEWELRLYAPEEMVIDGELALDDLCRFQIRGVTGDEVYILFDDQVQLGVPAGEVWTDLDNRLHVVIRDVRTARYQITDYVYDEEAHRFVGTRIMDQDGINYWGAVH